VSQFPTLEIVSDDQAVIVLDDFRYELKDGCAGAIIAMYQHQLTHDEVLARTYLVGVLAGLRHANQLGLERSLEMILASRSKE
jgi:hypothetical protein